MKKGEAGLTMLISVIVIIIILTQYLIFFVFFPSRKTVTNEYQISENDLLLINFARINSDLIVRSVDKNEYKDIENVVKNIDADECFEIKIKERTFKNCDAKNPEMTIMTIPDYNNNQIEITLLMGKK